MENENFDLSPLEKAWCQNFVWFVMFMEKKRVVGSPVYMMIMSVLMDEQRELYYLILEKLREAKNET